MSLNNTVTSSNDFAVVYHFSFCFTTSAVLSFTVCSSFLFCLRNVAVRNRYIPYNNAAKIIPIIVLNHQVCQKGGAMTISMFRSAHIPLLLAAFTRKTYLPGGTL